MIIKETNNQFEDNIAYQLGIEIGDLFIASFGYNMTIVEFYQIVGYAGKQSVKIKRVSPKIITQRGGIYEPGGSHTVYEIPNTLLPSNSQQMTVRVNASYNEPYLKIDNRIYAEPYHGEEVYECHLD